MALETILSGIQAETCDEITFRDITGSYDVTTNPTGWGAPNYETSDVVLAQLTFTNTSVLSTAVTYDITASFADLFTAGGLTLDSTTVLGTDTFADGYWEILYSVTMSDGTVIEYTLYLAIYCTVYCCVRRSALNYQVPITNYQAVQQSSLKTEYMMSLFWASCCGQVNYFNTILSDLQKLCEGCGTSDSTSGNTSTSGCGCN